jgi:hypothetical protein
MSSIIGALPSIFECPHCGETIDVSADTCRFCGTAVDRPLALHRAIILAKVNRACSDANYLRTCALAIPVFFVLRLVPFLSMLGVMGFVGLCFVIPVWASVWWTRFGLVESQDPDYIRSRKAVKIAGISVSILLLLFVVPILFVALLRILRAMHATS